MAGILMTDPGFGRGHTLGVKQTDQGTSVTGTQKAFSDSDPRTENAGKHLSNRPVTCLALRNMTGAAVEPGTVVAFSATDVLNAFDGSGSLQGVVDEYLPAVNKGTVDGVPNTYISGGCADKDVCWVIVSGPTAVATTEADGDIAAGIGVEADGAVGDGTADIGIAISPNADGFVRTLVGTISEHAIN